MTFYEGIKVELGLHVSSPAVASQIEDHFHSLIRNGHLERIPLL